MILKITWTVDFFSKAKLTLKHIPHDKDPKNCGAFSATSLLMCWLTGGMLGGE